MRKVFSVQLIITCFVVSFVSVVHAQSFTVSGTVLDSASMQPLPFVAIQIKNKPIHQASSEDGSFSIKVLMGDTLVFTRLNHASHIYVCDKEESHLIIRLTEIVNVLKEVIIYDQFKPTGSERWKSDVKPGKPIQFENRTMTQPSPGIVPTFGPGIVFGFGGKDKTKKNRDDFQKTKVFTATINSEDVKKQLMDMYSISSETYYRRMEAFNRENQDAVYLTNRDEIVLMLIQFFARKEP